MQEAFALTREPNWVLHHEGYSLLSESALESRFALANGFLGMRAARAISRGPTWLSWLGYIKWASWPRCYVAGLFDRPNTVPPVPALVPVADWLNGEPLLLSNSEMIAGMRSLDLRRGVLVSELTERRPSGITGTGCEMRLVSMADRALGLQLLLFSLDRDGIDVTLEANFGMSGLGMEPLRLEPDLGAWHAEGTGKSVAMAGAATLRAGGELLVPDRPFSLRWVWSWRSVAGQRTESSPWHGQTRGTPILPRLPRWRWRAAERWAGAVCLPRTKPHGGSAGVQPMLWSRATMTCNAHCGSPSTI
jgi:Glycosyl hydrolase family 65, N-terminal domain